MQRYSYHWPTYLEGAEKAGKKPLYDKWRVGRSILITNSNEEANEIINNPNGVFSNYFLYLNTVSKLASGTLSKDINIKMNFLML